LVEEVLQRIKISISDNENNKNELKFESLLSNSLSGDSEGLLALKMLGSLSGLGSSSVISYY